MVLRPPPKGWPESAPLSGLNCAPVAIRGTKAEFLEWIGAGLKRGEIQIPQP